MTWGEAIQLILENLSINKNQLSKATGIDRSNLTKFINGSRKPAASTILKLVQFSVANGVPFALQEIEK